MSPRCVSSRARSASWRNEFWVSGSMMTESKSEIRDGMQIEWDVPIEADDGLVLRADVFRPLGRGKHPVILSYGPYAKGLEFKQGYKHNWARLVKAAPEVLEGSSNKYQN